MMISQANSTALAPFNVFLRYGEVFLPGRYFAPACDYSNYRMYWAVIPEK
ncbi:hypothetical protein [Anaeroselena agilis]|uniref:Uncharacterized protein n=1 Tax=Anaeroselena agilis TaxID=3063788 RepID=A0ABU3NZ85_9FIRM|nr:hypothetical protein [Selenomonadales bacterium 4137-cl]